MQRDSRRRYWIGLQVVAGLLALGLAATAAAGQKVVLYTASNDEIEKVVMQAFQKAHPEIAVEAINLSTGPIAQRAIAEKANPQADVVWMVNDVALNQLKAAGCSSPTSPRGRQCPKASAIRRLLDRAQRDDHGPGGQHQAAAGEEASLARNLGGPDQARVQRDGHHAGGDQIGHGLRHRRDDVRRLRVGLPGSAPRQHLPVSVEWKRAGARGGFGEVAIGLTYDTAVIQQIRAGQPIEMVYGGMSPNVMEGAGLVAKGPNPKQGKLFMDFLFGPEAGKAFAPFVGISCVPGVANVDVAKVKMWKMKKPIDADAFKRDWAARYEKK